MTCRSVKLSDQSIVIVCGSKPKRKKCWVEGCRFDVAALCDYPIGIGTCDREMCHAHRIKMSGEETDYCSEHWPAYQANWEEKRSGPPVPSVPKP